MNKNLLVVSVSRQPRCVETVAQASLNIVKQVLQALNYDGIWSLAFIRQSTKREDIKFKFSRQQDLHSILIRTKPGDNSTCWDSCLTAPSKYPIQEVIGKMKRIHPRTLEINASPKLTKEKIKDALTPKEVMIGGRPISPVLEDLFHPPAGKALPNKTTPIEVVKEELDEVDREINERLHLKADQKDIPAEKPRNFIIPENIIEASDPLVLDHALMALGLSNVFDRSLVSLKRYCIPVGSAVSILVNLLELNKFVERSDWYRSPTRVASVILRNLKNKNYISPCLSRSMKEYEIKFLGWKRLEELGINLQALGIKLPPEYPKEPSNAVSSVDKWQSTEPKPPEQKSIEIVRENQQRLKPLSDEIDKILTDIEDYNRMEKDFENELKMNQDATSGLQASIDIIQKELSEKIKRMLAYEEKRLKLNADIAQVHSLIETSTGHLEQVKKQIKSIIGA